MTSKSTRLLFLALLLVYSLRAVSGTWISTGSPGPETALFLFSGKGLEKGHVSFQLPGFQLTEKIVQGKTYVIPVAANSAPILEAGAPDLPFYSFTLQVPATGNFEAVLLNGKYTEYPDLQLFPSPGNIVHGAPAPEPVFGPAYQADALYPGHMTDASTPYIARNERFQSFSVLPFQYNPVTRILRVYYEMEIGFRKLSTIGDNILTTRESQMSPIPQLQPAILNKDDVSMKAGSLPQDKGKMLIISPLSYFSALQPFIDWKTATGISCELSDASAFSDAAALADFIRSKYEESGFSYLLLAGDAEQVPTIQLPLGSSDNSYAYLAGNDHYPDILVGRFSASTVEELEMQLKKTIRYEKTPGGEAAWLTDVTGIASTMSPGDDGEADYEHVNHLLTELKNFTYTATSEFYDGSQGGGDADGNPGAASILDHINKGTGLILYTGHGTTNTWGTGNVSRSVVGEARNNGKYPFIWSVACEAGNFSGTTCLAESWMRASSSEGEPYGAVAALMASGTQTSCPPMEAQDEMVKGLTEAGNGGVSTFGGLSVRGMYKMNDIYGKAGYAITDTWILFGDPSLQVRTAQPSTMKVKHEPVFGLGMKEFGISSDRENAFACLSCNGKILGTAAVVNGKALIDIESQPQGNTVILTVTAFNCLPYQANIPVTHYPLEAEVLYPVNHSLRVPITPEFTWAEGHGATPDYYLFYLGTDNPPTNLVNGVRINATSFSPELLLDYQEKYYWRVVAVNSAGLATGSVHDFTAIFGPDEDFEKQTKTGSRWQASGITGWQIEQGTHFQGLQSCRSGMIADGEFSSMLFPCEVSDCDFTGFWFKVSSETNDKLQFMVDGMVYGEWGGEHSWTYASFSIEPGNHILEWRYSKNAGTISGSDAAWIDALHLPVHGMLQIQAEKQLQVCEDVKANTGATVNNYSSVEWMTSGDGTFSDPMLADAIYQPGEQDLEQGRVVLTLKVHGYAGCSVRTFEQELAILPAPKISLPDDIVSANGEAVVLDGWNPEAVSYAWLPGSEISSSITVLPDQQERGIKTITLQVTGQEGCKAEKTVRIHFNDNNNPEQFNVYPNPCTTSLTLEPVSGSGVLSSVSIVDSKGRTLWQQEGNIEIVDKRDFTLPAFPAATYFLIMQNSSGRTARPLMIQ